MCRRPAVSTSSTSRPVLAASRRAERARSAGSVLFRRALVDRQCRHRARSLSTARAPPAGRRPPKPSCGRWPFFESQRASLPVEVVLPDPCRPTISITLGGSLAKRSLDSWLPRILISSSLTISMTCCEGERAVSTSSPMAFSLMFSISCLTTRKLTSASSSATRISRSALSMFSAVSRPSPRRFLKTRCSLSDRLSNIRIELRSRGVRELGSPTPRRGRRRHSHPAGGHFAGPVHSQFVQYTGSRLEVGGLAFGQPRDMEENVPAAAIGAQEAEAFVLEIGHDRAGMLAGGLCAAIGRGAGLTTGWSGSSYRLLPV